MTTVSGDGRQSKWGGIRHQSQPGHQPLPVTEHPSSTVLPAAQLGGYLCPDLLRDFSKPVDKACQLSRQKNCRKLLAEYRSPPAQR